VLLVDIEDQAIRQERHVYWEELSPSEKIEKLKQWNAHLLLCGGISSSNKAKLESLHVEVVSELRGKAKSVLERWVRHAAKRRWVSHKDERFPPRNPMR
jgi:hypothetical protein